MKRLALALAMVACGKSKSEQAPEPQPEPERVSNRTLAATKLETVSSKAGAIAFAIDLPAAQLQPAEVKNAYATWDPKHATMDAPTFTVQFVDQPLSPDSTGDIAPIGDDAKDRTIARAEKLPDGGYLNLDQRNDHAFFHLEVCRPVPAGTLCCSVIERDSKPIEAFAEIVALADKVCRSMKAKA